MGLYLIDLFRARCQQLCRFLGTKEGFYMRKVSNPHRFSWYFNMAAVSLLWYTNMAAVKSCENDLSVVLIVVIVR